jgi:2-dehydropantoate 2-reductase
MPDRILIWGAGAIGGTVGAHLARAGHDVTFVDIVREHVERIRSGGLQITGPVDAFVVKVPALRPEEVSGTWPHIYLAVKAQHTNGAAEALKKHLADDGYVLSLQNGLCELDIANIVGRQRTIGAFINFGADWMGPGEILYANRGAVVLGELDGQMTARLDALHRVMRDFDKDAITTDKIFSYLWGKLAYASLLFAQALGDASIADCLARPELLPLWQRLAGETVRVAVAEGVEPLGFNGFDPRAFMPGATTDDARRCIDAMVAFNRPNAKTHSGVWRDLAVRKRPTEVDFQLAPIARIGEGHGLASPTIKKLVELIHEIETGKRPLADSNLNALLQS